MLLTGWRRSGPNHVAVAVASDYASALGVAQSRRFDVLVCDIGLPDRDGCDLLREVRSMYPIRGLAVTGYGMARDVRRCTEIGFDAHVVKPVAFEDVRSAIAAITSGAGHGAIPEDRWWTAPPPP